MNLFLSQNQNQFNIRPFQYRDLEAVEKLYDQADDTVLAQELEYLRRWYGLLKFLSWFPNPCQNLFNAYIAEQFGQVLGMIKVSPFNTTRSTWRIDRIFVDQLNDHSSIGSQLLRYCFETLWEARTWLLEVNVNDSSLI
jgi:L-amino acid N-acyltransferase YncA